MSHDEIMEQTLRIAREMNEDFDELDDEFQFMITYDIYTDLCYEEEAKYWAPVVEGLERDAKADQFSNPFDPARYWEWMAGEVE